jgi:N-acetyl-gamma-glutamyl-phosphate reductase
MIRAGIIGATGYTGAELVRILTHHPKVELTLLTSRQYADTPFAEIYPSLQGVVDLSCRKYSVELAKEQTDVVFMALPHQLPMAYVPELLDAGLKVIDLSADFRFKSAAVYETHYQAHTAKALLESSVYGLSEVYGEQIQSARLIGNPGCYPTSILLPLIPLLTTVLIDVDSIIADSKSGVSGAGRSLSLGTHYCEVNEGFKAYNVAAHRHNPEIEAILSEQGETDISITFVPHLVPMNRGMLSTIYVMLREAVDFKTIADCLADYYEDQPFVRVCPENQMPDVAYVRGTNCCDIGIKIDASNQRLILVSAIDNLVKGAAGQAVQNMNIMFGFEQTVGLQPLPAGF